DCELIPHQYTRPDATADTDVLCTGCAGNSAGKLTPGWSFPIVGYVGRYLSSESVGDETQPFRTARANTVVYSPADHKIYMIIGESLFVYESDTFFARVASPS